MSPETGNVNNIFPESESTFVERLRWMAAGRPMSRLMKDSGWAGGTIDRVLNEPGFIPGTEMLRIMARVENASLDWLANGFAPPFRVAQFRSPTAALDHLAALFDENDWQMNMYLSDHVRPVVVLSKPGTVERRGKPVRYTIIEVVAAPWTAAQICTTAKDAGITPQRTVVDSASLARLADGYTAGTYLLVRAPEPPFSQTMPAPTDSSLYRPYGDAEQPTRYSVTEPSADSPNYWGLKADEYRLLDSYRGLSAPDQARAVRIINALPDPEPTEPDTHAPVSNPLRGSWS